MFACLKIGNDSCQFWRIVQRVENINSSPLLRLKNCHWWGKCLREDGCLFRKKIICRYISSNMWNISIYFFRYVGHIDIILGNISIHLFQFAIPTNDLTFYEKRKTRENKKTSDVSTVKNCQNESPAATMKI